MFYLQRAEGIREHDEMKYLETGPDQGKSLKQFALPNTKIVNQQKLFFYLFLQTLTTFSYLYFIENYIFFDIIHL